MSEETLPPAEPVNHAQRAFELMQQASQSLAEGLLDRKRAEPEDLRLMRTYAIDFDGVIHTYDGWRDGTIYGEPMPGGFRGLKRLLRFGCVYILSTRDRGQIVEWMHTRGDIPCQALPNNATRWRTPGVIGVTNEKLLCTHIIDDRAVRFTNWTDIVNLLG